MDHGQTAWEGILTTAVVKVYSLLNSPKGSIPFGKLIISFWVDVLLLKEAQV